MPKQYKYLFIFFCVFIVAFLTVRCTPTAIQSIQSLDKNKGDSTESISQTTSITNSKVQQEATLQMAPSSTIEPSKSNDLKKIDPAAWLIYTDSVYHFSISYPPFFAIKHLNKDELAQISPLPQSPSLPPLAAISFQDQRKQLAEIAPPEFSIHIFENKTHQPIEPWLKEVGLLKREASLITEPYSGKYVIGIKVISQNYIAPGWSVFVTKGKYVFQLTPLGTEAELMLDTFAFTK